MTKEVLLSIRGLQFEGDMDGEQIETITSANYYKRKDQHFIIYEEMMEGFEEPTKGMIRFSEREMSITKRGLVNMNMLFEEKKKNMTNYKTPYGNILIGIDTEKVAVSEQEEKIAVEVSYSMEVNYEYLADCNIKMDIIAKDSTKKTWCTLS